MFPNNSPRHGQLGGYQQQPGYEYGGGGGVYGDQWPPNYHLYRWGPDRGSADQLTNLHHQQVQRHWVEPPRCCSRCCCSVPASVSCPGLGDSRRSPLLRLQTPSALPASSRGLQTSDIQWCSSPGRAGGERWARRGSGPGCWTCWPPPPLPWLRPRGLWRPVRLRLPRPASLPLPALQAPAGQVAVRVDEETKSFCQTLQRRSGG